MVIFKNVFFFFYNKNVFFRPTTTPQECLHVGQVKVENYTHRTNTYLHPNFDL
jgi:hypothetical protein